MQFDNNWTFDIWISKLVPPIAWLLGCGTYNPIIESSRHTAQANWIIIPRTLWGPYFIVCNSLTTSNHSHNRNVNDSRGRSSHLTPVCAILPNFSACVGVVLTRSSIAFPLGSPPGSRSPYFYVMACGSYGVAQHWHRIIWARFWKFEKSEENVGVSATGGFWWIAS